MRAFKIAAAFLSLLAVPLSAQIQRAFTASEAQRPSLRPTAGPCAGGASPKAILWDQTDLGLNAWVDQTFSDYPGSSSFQVSDISTGTAAWRVTKVTTYFTYGLGGGAWSPAAITTGNLQVYPKASGLPSNAGDIAPEYTVPITLVDAGNFTWAVEADTSGIAELQSISGDFWIGLTPNTSWATSGQEYHWVATAAGGLSALRNPGGVLGLGTSWVSLGAADTIGAGGPYDGAIRLEGEVVGKWTNLGFALPGIAGAPLLVGTGDLIAGSACMLMLSNAAPSAPMILFVALSGTPVAFKGGTLVPVPPALTIGLSTLANGTLPLPFAWPSGLPPAFSMYYQYGIKDTAAVQKVALSNAVQSTTP